MTLMPAIAMAWALAKYSAKALAYLVRPSTMVHPIVVQITDALRDLSRCDDKGLLSGWMGEGWKALLIVEARPSPYAFAVAWLCVHRRAIH
jgi:hypothetical protein